MRFVSRYLKRILSCLCEPKEPNNGSYCLASDAGKIRADKPNEDRVLFREVATGDVPVHLMAVIDGMGGHSGGDVAAEIALNVLRNVTGETSNELWTSLKLALAKIDLEIRNVGDGRPEVAGMGVALTAIHCHGNQLRFIHIGDTRLYHIRGSSVTQMTNDHNKTGQLLRSGGITKDEVFGHPMSNIILRCLNGDGDQYDEGGGVLKKGDMLLLSSDGLHDVVPQEEWFKVVDGTEQVCSQLVALAHSYGAPDNISVAVYVYGS